MPGSSPAEIPPTDQTKNRWNSAKMILRDRFHMNSVDIESVGVSSQVDDLDETVTTISSPDLWSERSQAGPLHG
jgi:hypothetical protein